MTGNADWQIYSGSGVPHDGISRLPAPPPWRRFDGTVPDPVGDTDAGGPDGREVRPGERRRAETYLPSADVVNMVNTALYLRRPLLVTGRPGTGKSSLAYSIAHELRLGPVLYWPITTRSQVQDALYRYDAIGRLQETNVWRLTEDSDRQPDIGNFVQLGPLGTALLPSRRPRVLLIDEIDKSDIDLPNDLLSIFEEGQFEIPELARLSTDEVRVFTSDPLSRTAAVRHGLVRCAEFPIIVITSNAEREMPLPFLRRCLSLTTQQPGAGELAEIVRAQLGAEGADRAGDLIETFVRDRARSELSTDQLLNAVHLIMAANPDPSVRDQMVNVLLRPLGPREP